MVLERHFVERCRKRLRVGNVHTRVDPVFRAPAGLERESGGEKQSRGVNRESGEEGAREEEGGETIERGHVRAIDEEEIGVQGRGEPGGWCGRRRAEDGGEEEGEPGEKVSERAEHVAEDDHEPGNVRETTVAVGKADEVEELDDTRCVVRQEAQDAVRFGEAEEETSHQLLHEVLRRSR